MGEQSWRECEDGFAVPSHMWRWQRVARPHRTVVWTVQSGFDPHKNGPDPISTRLKHRSDWGTGPVFVWSGPTRVQNEGHTWGSPPWALILDQSNVYFQNNQIMFVKLCQKSTLRSVFDVVSMLLEDKPRIFATKTPNSTILVRWQDQTVHVSHRTAKTVLERNRLILTS